METRIPLVWTCTFVVLFQVTLGWSGNYCSRVVLHYYATGYTCSDWWCWWRSSYTYPVYHTEYYCCPGWRESWGQNCNIPVCSPECRNGGTCIAPNQCRCPVQYRGSLCDESICSHLAPCYPGNCLPPDRCACQEGFTSVSPSKQNYCLKFGSNPSMNMNVTHMRVRLSYWPRNVDPRAEKYFIIADSTSMTGGKEDSVWIRLADFNRLNTTFTCQFAAISLPLPPSYVSEAKFGIVSAGVDVWLLKTPLPGSREPRNEPVGQIKCPKEVSRDSPATGLYECDVKNEDFIYNLEHGDHLKIKFKAQAGGYRKLYDLNTHRVSEVQYYEGFEISQSAEFRFDHKPPSHCQETTSCLGQETMLRVEDITKNSLTINWNGWMDEDSQMGRYVVEIFKLTKTIDNNLEIKRLDANKSLFRTEMMHPPNDSARYQPPEPGMYSIILEADDLAKNAKYVRRLCLYDPVSNITTDPNQKLYVSTASPVADYSYQGDNFHNVMVTWEGHFRNDFHDQNALLGNVLEFPPQLGDFPKSIPRALDDQEGRRTIHAIPNVRGIVNFEAVIVKDNTGGRSQPITPKQKWINLNLNTTLTVSDHLHETPLDGETLTIWVKARDALDNYKIQRTRVTFDSKPPSVGNLSFLMNTLVPGIDFSSTFHLTAKDAHSGIAHVTWSFARKNGSVIYNETVKGRRDETCGDFVTNCYCTPAHDCFSLDQSFSLSNCHMMVEKESLAVEVVTVSINVTNMAGIVTNTVLQISNLTHLNGTKAYYPPQNLKVKALSDTSITLTWDFPPSCFERTELWAVVEGEVEKRVVHKDAVQFDVTGLNPETTYKISMQTAYGRGDLSDLHPITITTTETPTRLGLVVGVAFVGLLIALIICFTVSFALWKKGYILQKPSRLTSQFNRIDNAYRTFKNRRSTRTSRAMRKKGEKGARLPMLGSGYTPGESADGDEIYIYGGMTFQTQQPWQLNQESITLLERIAEGKFADVYKAHWTKPDGDIDTVAVKMLKPGFTDDDALKMMAKINFFATQLQDHENILMFKGAVTGNMSWGPVIVMEFCRGGQLDKWLVAHRQNVTEQIMEDLFQFSLGIAAGMEYLASRKVTHKRLAARNVLLTSRGFVRVYGFGPQHKEGDEDKTTRVPAKWVAPEVLVDEPSTEKSDVWSFGVVMWEIFSMGEVPYKTIHSNEIGKQLKQGYRMEKPEFADDMWYELMQECWAYKPDKRPTFKSIHAKLTKLYSPDRPATDMYYATNELID